MSGEKSNTTYRLGVDVGGTNTDAVLIDDSLAVVAEVKLSTTADVYGGIMAAVKAILEKSGVDRTRITRAMLGTTHCTNAIVERKRLSKIGVLRIGAPATAGIKPMVDWADDLKAIAVETEIIRGGFEYDGKELSVFDEAAARAFFARCKDKGIQSVALSQLFSVVRDEHEVRAAELCSEVMGGALSSAAIFSSCSIKCPITKM